MKDYNIAQSHSVIGSWPLVISRAMNAYQLGGQSLYLLLIRLFPLVGLDSSEALQLVLCWAPSVAQSP